MQKKTFSHAVLGSSSLVAVLFSLPGTAAAQLTIQSTGTLSGTIQLPANNPNFNNRVTRIDTDSTGTYYRNQVFAYQSNYVKVQTRSDGSLRYFVDFKGIPVVSFDGVLTSPVLSSGELKPFSYQGRLPGTKFQGVVQDEFGLSKAFYTGIVTDPKTGQQYQGTFEVNGQGPRYSDVYDGLRLPNGGASPTVFDFKSDIPGNPTVKSIGINNSPLVRLTIKVPAGTTPLNTSTNTPTPINNTSTNPPTSITNISTPSTNNNTPTSITNISTPSTSTNPPTSITSTDTPISITSNSILTETTSQNLTTLKPTTEPNLEFSSGNSYVANTANLESSSITSTSCSLNSVNCRPTLIKSKQLIGPRSRVLIR